MNRIPVIFAALVLLCVPAGRAAATEDGSDTLSGRGPLAAGAAGQPPALTAEGKARYFFESTFGLKSFGFTAAGTGIRQAYGAVPEWGGGLEGYGKRYASSFGQKAIDRSIRIGLQTLLREEPRFIASGKSGIFSRTVGAASRTFVIYRDNGGARPAYTRWAGVFAAAYVSRRWHPDSYGSASSCVAAGLTSIGLDAAGNVWNEFWPDLKKRLRR